MTVLIQNPFIRRMRQRIRSIQAVLLLLALLGAGRAAAQLLPAYALFNAQGGKLSHKQMLRTVAGADVVLFGEQHNNAIAHWLQLEVARDLAARGPLVLGAEMIEADDQVTLDRYLRGEIDSAAFDTLARLWKNHATDYAPLVKLAKDRQLPFVAANAPRQLARAVSKGGFEALDTVPDAQRAFLAPLPIAFEPELPGYVKMLGMMGDHATPNIVKAQALKDATMAHFILQALAPGKRFLHFNGSYHSDYHEGIGWYLKRARPDLKVVTIATITSDQLKKLPAESLGQADIIICVDEDVPGSY